MQWTFSIIALTLSRVAGSAIPIDVSVCTKAACYLPAPPQHAVVNEAGSNFVFSRSKQEYASNMGYAAFTANYGSPTRDDLYETEDDQQTSSEEEKIEYYPAKYDTTEEYYLEDSLESSEEAEDEFEEYYPTDYDVIDDYTEEPIETYSTEEPTSQMENNSDAQATFSAENYDISNHGYTPQVIYEQGQESAPEQVYAKASIEDDAPLLSNSQRQGEEVSAIGKAYFCTRKPHQNKRSRKSHY